MDLQKYNIYPTFRKYQEDTIKKIIDFVTNSDKRYLIVQAPTGSGKSVVAYVAAHYLSDQYSALSEKVNSPNHTVEDINEFSKQIRDSYIITSKNLLLDQYYNDFNKTMPVVKGRVNYKCIQDQRPCSEGICVSKSVEELKKLHCYSKCPYQLAKKMFLFEKVSSTNFALLLKYMRNTNFSAKDLVIVDECQAIEGVLRDEFVVPTTEKTINMINKLKEEIRLCNSHVIIDKASHNFERLHGSLKKINLKVLDYDSISDVNNFLEDLHEEVVNLYMALEYGINAYVKEDCNDDISLASKDPEVKKYIKAADKLKCFASNIKNYFAMKDSIEWIVQEHKTPKGEVTGFEVKPVTIDLLTASIFKRIAKKKVVMMSATIGDYKRFAKSLGIDPNDVEFIDIPHTFPVENRPFVVLPICSMKYQDMEKNLPKITEACDDILDMYPQQKGIIHSVSFKNAIYLREHMVNANRILIHDDKNKDLILREFKESKNKVLVSPSLIEGFDFKGDLSEFQIFIKVPYMSLTDKVVKRRMELDQEWYINNAILQILQGVGRSVRSETDVATTFCLDSNINFLLSKYRHLFTPDFLRTVQRP